MKWLHSAITGQNLYLKLAIFITGIVTGLESSFRQLLSQIALFLVFLLLEPRLYLSVLSALRRVLPFFAGYWLFATLFSQSFPVSVRFSIQIIYLVLVTVAVFGGEQMRSIASDSHWLRQNRWINALFFYAFATWLYVKSFFHHYHIRQKSHNPEPLSALIEAVFSTVSAETESIRSQLREVLAYHSEDAPLLTFPNVSGLLFLALLIVVNGI